MSLLVPFAVLAGLAGALATAAGDGAIGIPVLAASVLLLCWPHSVWHDGAGAGGAHRQAVGLLAAACALGAFFRFYRLEQPGLWGDDALNGLLAFDVLDGRIRSPFALVKHSHSYFHALANYPIAAAFWLFGPDIWTLRLPGTLLGLACIPLLYAIAAPLFGSLTAALAALLYATAPLHVIHSKELIQLIMGQFFQLAGLALLVNGLAGGRRSWIILAALPLALCVYTYHSVRLAPAVAVVYASAVLWSTPAAQGRRRRAAAGWGLALFTGALIPVVVGAWRQPEKLWQRMEQTSLWPLVAAEHSLWPAWETAWRTLAMFHYQQGPEYFWFGIATDPALSPIVGFALLHGLVQSLRFWRQPRHVLLLTWCATGLLPALLSTGAPRIYRAFLATPPLFVWAAMPLAALLTLPGSRMTRLVARATAVALLAAVPLLDFDYYFHRVYTDPTFRWYQGERIVAVARLLRSLGPGWHGYLLSERFDASHETLRFLGRAWQLELDSISRPSDAVSAPPTGRRGIAYLMSPELLGALEPIERRYPSGTLTLARAPMPRGGWLDRWWSHGAPPALPGSDITAAMYAVPSSAGARSSGETTDDTAR